MSATLEKVPAQTSRAVQPEVPDYAAEERGTGWVGFAAIMLVIGGVLGVIYGIVAVARSSFYVAGAHFVFSDLNTWGWIVMIVGALTLVAGLYVLSGSEWARWFGIVVASLQALAQIMFAQAYPFWSLCLFAIDILVIYALAVYGGRRLRT